MRRRPRRLGVTEVWGGHPIAGSRVVPRGPIRRGGRAIDAILCSISIPSTRFSWRTECRCRKMTSCAGNHVPQQRQSQSSKSRDQRGKKWLIWILVFVNMGELEGDFLAQPARICPESPPGGNPRRTEHRPQSRVPVGARALPGRDGHGNCEPLPGSKYGTIPSKNRDARPSGCGHPRPAAFAAGYRWR